MNNTIAMPLLWLLQLSDTALPIGALNHSFGLETLAAEEPLQAGELESFLHDYLQEVSALEVHFCGAAHRLGIQTLDRFPSQDWVDLNMRLGAFKLARESRIASAMLGRRLVRLVNEVASSPILLAAIDSAQDAESDIHHCAAFGLAGAALGIEEHGTLLAYAHQSLANLISASQRLLPVGQSQAVRMLWQLKPVLTELAMRARESHFEVSEPTCFAPLMEMGSMRHPGLATRLFVS